MKFLCLPGAYGNAENFKVQLAPFVKEMTKDGTATFYYAQGTNKCNPPPGFDDYFGPPPHYRFIEYDGIKQSDVLERVRDFPEGENAEDVLRELMPEGDEDIRNSVKRALDALYATMEEHGPFDGIVGYSEGTVVGGTLIMDERRRFEEEGRPRQIKRAIFFNGWPPLNPYSSQVLLSDTMSVQGIDVPTLHCTGADDPYLHGAIALFNICDPDSAILFDHGKGHTIPRDVTTLIELGEDVRGMGAAVF